MSWLIDGLLPSYGSVNLLAGSTHAGKSTLLYGLVEALRKGEGFHGFGVTRPPYISVVLADRPLEDNTLWARARHEGLIDHLFVAVEDDKYIAASGLSAKQSGAQLFTETLARLPRRTCMLLIVDVFTSTFIGDPHSSWAVKRNMDLINHVCWRDKITLLGTAYGVKPTNDKRARYERYIDRVIGAAPLRGGASSILYLASKPEAEGDGFASQVLETVPRNGPPIRIGLELRDEDGVRRFHVVPIQPLEQAKRQEPDPDRACYAALPFVPHEPARVGDIYEAFVAEGGKCSPSGFRRWLAELVDLGEADNPERGLYGRKKTN